MPNPVFPTPFTPGFRLVDGSLLNTLFSNQVYSSQYGITALAGGGRSGATPITAMNSSVDTVATAADSVVLPAAAAGCHYFVANNGAAAMQVFANGSDTIDGTAGATGIAQASGANILFVCSQNGKWDTYGADNAGAFTSLTVSGLSTLTGGFVLATSSPINWADGGTAVLATAGTDSACTNGDRYWVSLMIPRNVTLTGLAYLIGSVGGTDKVITELHNSAGVLVATSALAGATVGTAANIQGVDFTAPYAAIAGRYYAALQFNGTTAKFRTYPIPGSKIVAATAAGTFGTSAAITPGTTFTADKGPICYTY